MKNKFKKVGYRESTHGINYGKNYVMSLNPGTVIGEYYIDWIIDVLNGKREEPPPHPFIKCKKCKEVYCTAKGSETHCKCQRK